MGYTYFHFREHWIDTRHGIPLMFWGAGLLVATAVALYILDGRTPVSRETPAKLLSPAAPYPKLGWAAFAVAVFGVALVLLGDHNIVELGALLVVLSVPLAVLFAVMAVVVKRR